MLFFIDPSPRLTGIARMANESPVLEAKRRVEYHEIDARSLLSRCDSPRVPFRWSINPYRGCEYGCQYCYARYTHEFMELRDPEDFERKIFAKRWSQERLRQELGRIPRSDAIAIGTATDPYQPSERRFGITRRILNALSHERGRKFVITTKSDLVARDAVLLAEIARANVLHVSFTITTVDEELARQLEPYAPRPELRLRALRRLRDAGVGAGVCISPVMPWLNDSPEAIDAVARAATKARSLWLAGQPLFLKPCSMRVFLPFLKENFPHLVRRYESLFGASGFLGRRQAESVQGMIARARVRYGLGEQLPEYVPEMWSGEPQLNLFTGRRESDPVKPRMPTVCG